MFPPMTAPASPAPDTQPVAMHTVDLDGHIVDGAGSIFDALDDRSRERAADAMATLRAGRAPSVSWESVAGTGAARQVLLHHVMPRHGDDRAVEGFVFCTVDVTAGDRARAAIADAGLALARVVTTDELHRELARQLRQVAGAQAHAVAIMGEADARANHRPGDGTEEGGAGGTDDDTSVPAAVHLSHAAGYAESPEALARSCANAWRTAIETGELHSHDVDGGLELTVPIPGATTTLGAMTVLVTELDPVRRPHVERAVAAIGAQVGAAIERGRRARRAAGSERLDVIAEVATGVAHELRNPLFGISSAGQLLRFRSHEDPVVEKNVGRILREVERLNRMAASLLEYGRTDTAPREPGDPDAVWDAVLESNRGALEARALILRRTRADRPASVLLDAERLAQVFTNVLANAIDHAPEASDLTLHSETLPDGSWRCRLHNAGPAIPPDVLPHVFDIFYSTRPGGIGLGLALSERIVQEHGGTIALESAPREGTTATIGMPGAGGRE